MPPEIKSPRQLEQRKYALKRYYGITLEQYDYLFKKQKGRCAICQKGQEEFKMRLAVDHDHRSGEIFGLLCTFCNRRFIGRNRNPELYKRAAKYLSHGTGWFVPKKSKRKRK